MHTTYYLPVSLHNVTMVPMRALRLRCLALWSICTLGILVALRRLAQERPEPHCSVVHPLEQGVKVVRFMGSSEEERLAMRVFQSETGQRCAFLSDTECSTSGQIDGVVWNGVHPSAPAHWPEGGDRRTPANRHQIWFAWSHEVHAPPHWPRLIGDGQWMASMNYGYHFGTNADFPVAALSAFHFDQPQPGSGEALFNGKTQSILYLSSNCKTQSERDDFMRRASLYMDIDSLGQCEHNKDIPLRLKTLEEDSEGRNVRQRWGNYGPGNRAILKNYRFRLLVISTLCDDYFAEKVKQTLQAGVIPIYLGMPNSHDWDPGIAAGVHPAMIHVQDFDGLLELAKFVRALGADTNDARERRLRYFEYLRKPPSVFPRHREQWMEKSDNITSWDEFVCRRVHDGDPGRKIDAQRRCRGPWWQYFDSIGKNLSRWGCNAQQPCALSNVSGSKASTRRSFFDQIHRHSHWLILLLIFSFIFSFIFSKLELVVVGV
jgi:hypothetical protein